MISLSVSPEGGVWVTPDNATFSGSDTVILECLTLGGPGSIDNETSASLTAWASLTLPVFTAEDGGSYNR